MPNNLNNSDNQPRRLSDGPQESVSSEEISVAEGGSSLEAQENTESAQDLQPTQLSNKAEDSNPNEADQASNEADTTSAAKSGGELDSADSIDSIDSMESMDKLLEDSPKCPSEGEVLKGTVVQIGKEFVMVDVGAKSEGRIPLSEFTDAENNLCVQLGDQVDALVIHKDDDDGEISLSKEKAVKMKIWEEIAKVHNEDGIIRGVVTGRVKGGLSVDIGVAAFLPGSQVDTRPVKNLESHIEKTYDFKVLKFNRRRGNVVLSRRVILEAERDLIRSKTISSLEVGAVVEGIIKNLTDYGAFVELGGLDGLLHVTDMSWGRISNPGELLGVGDKVTVKVLAFDKDKGRVSLGLKQLKEDPWVLASTKYKVGDRVSGKVVSLTDYGAFVELESGLEGLIHVSEMSWTRKVRNPSSVLKVGDFVEAIILNMDSNAKRISLGMKQVEPNPWDSVSERYPIGTIIEGKIKNITDFGAFIGIDEGIDGLVHISDISWNRRFKHPSEVFKKGDSVRAVILSIDREQERFSLGIKQLVEDPWAVAFSRFPVGETVTGRVTNVTDFGIFLELDEGIEGLIHVSESGIQKGKPLSEAFKVGDNVTAKVVSVSTTDHKIGLSVKSKNKEGDEARFKEFAADGGKGGASAGQTSNATGSFGAAFGNLDKLLAEKKQTSDTEA
ncbi:MAG: 30S ribosomal protein S1 [Deltaproteobacteria bacterium]|nr:30S ribosomal protein S1 [Deltaproteobacteria bacterium]